MDLLALSLCSGRCSGLPEGELALQLPQPVFSAALIGLHDLFHLILRFFYATFKSLQLDQLKPELQAFDQVPALIVGDITLRLRLHDHPKRSLDVIGGFDVRQLQRYRPFPSGWDHAIHA
jgi:hypothetical protein